MSDVRAGAATESPTVGQPGTDGKFALAGFAFFWQVGFSPELKTSV